MRKLVGILITLLAILGCEDPNWNKVTIDSNVVEINIPGEQKFTYRQWVDVNSQGIKILGSDALTLEGNKFIIDN